MTYFLGVLVCYFAISEDGMGFRKHFSVIALSFAWPVIFGLYLKELLNK